MALERFDPPGFVDDLNGPQKDAWSEWISGQIDEARERGTGGPVTNGPRLQFFNPLKTAPANDAIEKDITWSAFPRIVRITSVSDLQRWRLADGSRDRQDEYCEWSVARDLATERIIKVTFTSEGPEYWRFLAHVNPNRVLELYQEHVSPLVKRSDLFLADGSYDSRNRWNNSTDNGAMHLIQRANTLGAEIELAAAATIVRRRNGGFITAERELIECGRYGEPERFSDPHIGAEVNALARQKADITLSNPVGLCIAGISVATWETPDGSNPLDYWKVTRGTPEKALRAVYEVPPDKGFVVGDITIAGRKIEYGAQIADHLTIKLTGLATRIGQSTIKPVTGCVGGGPDADLQAEIDGMPSVASILARRSKVSR
jgi:hypothetical protein